MLHEAPLYIRFAALTKRKLPAPLPHCCLVSRPWHAKCLVCALCLPKLFSLHHILWGRLHTWVPISLLSAANSSSLPPPHTCRYVFNPRDNLLQVEVCMAEGCMPPTVLLVATAKAAKAVLKEQPGINNYAKSVQVRGNCTQGLGGCL